MGLDINSRNYRKFSHRNHTQYFIAQDQVERTAAEIVMHTMKQYNKITG